jgi:hypothetical protein
MEVILTWKSLVFVVIPSKSSFKGIWGFGGRCVEEQKAAVLEALALAIALAPAVEALLAAGLFVVAPLASVVDLTVAPLLSLEARCFVEPALPRPPDAWFGAQGNREDL